MEAWNQNTSSPIANVVIGLSKMAFGGALAYGGWRLSPAATICVSFASFWFLERKGSDTDVPRSHRLKIVPLLKGFQVATGVMAVITAFGIMHQQLQLMRSRAQALPPLPNTDQSLMGQFRHGLEVRQRITDPASRAEELRAGWLILAAIAHFIPVMGTTAIIPGRKPDDKAPGGENLPFVSTWLGLWRPESP